MTPPDRFNRFALLGVLLLAAVLRLAVAWQPLDVLVTHTMPDDAFYYLQVARNIADGNGVTFDGAELANGFHPLWMACLLPVYAIAGDDGLLGVHLALTLAAAFDLLTIVVIAWGIRDITGRATAGLAGAAWYALNPAAVVQAMNGLETSVNVLCLAGLFAFAVRARSRDVLGTGSWITFGVLAGAAMLARMDNVVPVVVVGVGLLMAPFRPARVRGLLLAALIGAVCVGPWLWWNAAHTGSIVPTSANAYSVVTRARMDAVTVVAHALRDTFTLFTRTIPIDVVGESKAVGMALGVLVAALALSGATRLRESFLRLALPALACLALLLTHSLVRGTVKTWYLAPAALIVAYAIGIVWQALAEGDTPVRLRRWGSVVVCLGIGSGFILNGSWYVRRPSMPWQKELLEAGQWLGERDAPGTVAGAFNAGIIAYVANRPVVNLDGLVNVRAAQSVEERQLGAYIDERGLDVLVDFEYSLFRDYEPFYGEEWHVRDRFHEVTSFQLPDGAWAGTHVKAYRLVPPPAG